MLQAVIEKLENIHYFENVEPLRVHDLSTKDDVLSITSYLINHKLESVYLITLPIELDKQDDVSHLVMTDLKTLVDNNSEVKDYDIYTVFTNKQTNSSEETGNAQMPEYNKKYGHHYTINA
mgnify:CR=1 FL=1